MTTAAVAQRGRGIVRRFNEAGVITAADVHVALRLGALAAESNEIVHLATALTVRAVRSGSVCLDLTRFRDITTEDPAADGAEEPENVSELPWPDTAEVLAALRVSPLVVGSERGPLRPLVLVDTAEGPLLYLDRYHMQENIVRTVLDSRATTRPVVDADILRAQLAERFPGDAPDRQRVAAALAATSWTTVIAGGPGTGKTHTVARILVILAALEPNRPLRLGLAAPTGKAAARLQESVTAQAAALGLTARIEAMTLHRLLGWQPGGRFRYNRGNRLAYDVVVVDETSMVSLTMMSRIIEAVRPDARLLLVGDPDQLTSVDAGAVLADLVARSVPTQPNPVLTAVVAPDLQAADTAVERALDASERERVQAGVIRLSRGRRFGAGIVELAAAVRDGDADTVMELLHSGSPAIIFCGPDDLDGLRTDIVETDRRVTAAARMGDAVGALAALGGHRLLCAHRDGRYGVQRWKDTALAWVSAAHGGRLDPTVSYVGQPLLVTANDHDSRIYNGDAGVIIIGADGELAAAFDRAGEPVLIPPSRLSAVQTVYAMTIHRSQGSEYDAVSVLLPARASALLTRELLYTAITRARSRVRIIGTEESVRAGVGRQVMRASGLQRVPLQS